MSRKGRELEIILKDLYENKNFFNVKSPGFLIDQITGTKREVDVFANYRDLDNKERILVVEARDRKGRQDITWIEQASSKRVDCGVDTMILVSSGDFTGPSLVKAKAKGLIAINAKNLDLEILIESNFLEHVYTKIVVHRVLTHGMNYSSSSKMPREYYDMLFEFNDFSIDAYSVALRSYQFRQKGQSELQRAQVNIPISMLPKELRKIYVDYSVHRMVYKIPITKEMLFEDKHSNETIDKYQEFKYDTFELRIASNYESNTLKYSIPGIGKGWVYTSTLFPNQFQLGKGKRQFKFEQILNSNSKNALHLKADFSKILEQ